MSGYIGNIPVPQATQTRDVFTATSGQTTFATSGYSPGFLDVYQEGVHLTDGVDYTATNGSDVVLTVGATSGDVVEVVAYTTFSVADALTTSDIGVSVQGYSSVLANTTASFTTADETKLDGIEASADVTDTANVTAAGALMDSELTNEAAVKALNQGVATTDSPTFAGATVNGNIAVTGTVDGRDVAADGTKLDGIEAGAEVNPTASEILTSIKTVDGAGSGLDADLLDGQQGSYYLDGNNFINLPAGYTGWTVSDGTNSENVADSDSVIFTGSGATSVSYNTTSNTMTISSTDTNTTYSAGTGLSLVGTTFNNTAPDQTVSLTQGSNVTITGTYPNFTIASTDTNTTYSAGTALDLSGTTFNVDLSELSTSVTDGDGDFFVVVDSLNAQRKLTKGNINISGFNNDAGYTTNVGDITGVTAGSGLTGGGTSGTVTVSHADTSSQASVNNSGNTVIQDVTLDTYGHVTGLTSTTIASGAGYFQGENGNTGDTTNGKGDIFRTHESTLNTNVTIASGDNSLAAGPLTVASGVTLTVSGNLSIV